MSNILDIVPLREGPVSGLGPMSQHDPFQTFETGQPEAIAVGVAGLFAVAERPPPFAFVETVAW